MRSISTVYESTGALRAGTSDASNNTRDHCTLVYNFASQRNGTLPMWLNDVQKKVHNNRQTSAQNASNSRLRWCRPARRILALSSPLPDSAGGAEKTPQITSDEKKTRRRNGGRRVGRHDHDAHRASLQDHRRHPDRAGLHRHDRRLGQQRECLSLFFFLARVIRAPSVSDALLSRFGCRPMFFVLPMYCCEVVQ